MINGKRGRDLSIITVLCAGLILTAGATYLGYKFSRIRTESIFNDAAAYRFKFIEDTMQYNLSTLESFADFYAASVSVEKGEFESFAKGALSRNPAILEFRWVERVPGAERDVFEMTAREVTGIADFHIKELDKDGRIVIAGKRDEYFPVYYLTCPAGHICDYSTIAGLDSGSFPDRWNAMRKARDTAKPAVATEVRVIGEPAVSSASRIYLPIYNKDVPHDTVKERAGNMAGFVSMLYNVGKMVDGSLSAIPSAGVDIAVYEESPDGSPRFLYFRPSPSRKNPGDPAIDKDLLKLKKKGFLSWSGTMSVAGSRWLIVCAPSPEFYLVYRIILPWVVLMTGLLITFLGSRYFASVIGRTRVIEALVTERTGQLRRAEEKYRALFEYSRDAIMTIAPPDWNFASGNTAALNMFAVKDEKEFIAKGPWEFSPERQPDRELSSVKARRMIEIAVENGSNSFEWMHKKASGEEFPASVLLSRVESQGQIFLQATVRDITDIKNAEEKITRANREWADTFNSISDFVFILDRDSAIKKVNKIFLDTLGLKESDVIGKKCYEVVHKTSVPWMKCPHQQTIADNKPHTEEVDDPGLGLPLLITTSPIIDEKGGFLGTVHIAKDISQIKKTEEDLRKAKEDLEIEAWGLAKANEGIRTLYKDLAAANEQLKKIDQLKSDFVSVVSHELRTPLAIMKEGVSLVLDNITGDIGDKTRNTLGMVFTNINRLASLINDLLDISKIESGKMQLKKSVVNINNLVWDAVEKWKMTAEKKSQEIKVAVKPGRIDAYLDQDKIIQVINNLVSNAIKFTPDGGRISVEVRDDKDAVEVSISDTGVGISAEDLPKVFEKFRQFNRPAGSGAKGTGLGLAITRELVTLHEGRIMVESKPGAGSRFTFTLPKKDSETVFMENLGNGIKEAAAEGAYLSIISVRIPSFFDLRQDVGADRAKKLLDDLKDVIAESLRRKEDVVIEGVMEFIIMLMASDRKATEAVKQRVEEAVSGYLAASEDRIFRDLTINIGIASYPSDADKPEFLLNKARGVIKV